MINLLLTLTATTLYMIAFVRLSVSLYRPAAGATNADAADSLQHSLPEQPDPSRNTTLVLASVALTIHAWLAFAKSGLPDALTLPFFTALLVTGLTIVIIQLVISLQLRTDYLGIAVYPLAALTLLGAQFVQTGSEVLPNSIQIHVLLSIIAYALLALAAAQAILASVQRKHLKSHKPGGFMLRLPPLTSTESLLFTLLGIGFVMLTLSLVSGFIYLDDMFAQSLAHKTILSCLAWAIFGVLLFRRWRFGWRGKTAVQWTLAGFAVLLLAYFGSKLVLELILQR